MRQGAWAVVGQAANSIGNLLLTVVVARQATPTEFGVFSLVLTYYLLALNGSRAVAATPLLLSVAGEDRRHVTNEVRGSIGGTLIVSFVLSAPAVVIGPFIGGLGTELLVAFGLLIPFLLLQDAVRYAFAAQGRLAWSAASDVTWLLLQVAATLTLGALGSPNILQNTLIWGGAAAVAALAGLGILRVRPSINAGRAFLVRHRRLLPDLFGDYLATNVITQLTPYAVAMAAGLIAAGALRAGLVLLGVVNIVIMGLTPVGQLEARKLHKHAPDQASRFMMRWTLVVTTISVLYGAFLLALPASAGEVILGDTWTETEPLILPLVIFLLVRPPYTVAQISLRAQLRLREALTMRVITAPFLVILPTIGAFFMAAVGAAYGLAAAGFMASAWSLWITRRSST